MITQLVTKYNVYEINEYSLEANNARKRVVPVGHCTTFIFCFTTLHGGICSIIFIHRSILSVLH